MTAQVDRGMDSTKYQQIVEADVTQSVKKLKLKLKDFHKRIMILNILQNPPRTTPRNARWPKNSAEPKVFYKEEWAKIPKAKTERRMTKY